MNSAYGFWSSPIHLGALSSPPLSFQEIGMAGGKLFWTESRPLEKGRSALMSFCSKEGIQEELPLMNVQTRVHEYGGGAFKAFSGRLVFFDTKTTALYLRDEEGVLHSLIQDPLKRFADFSFSPCGNFLVCVCEDHREQSHVENYLVEIDLQTFSSKIIAKGCSFYASPKFSLDGKRLAYLSWNAPHMPWDECNLTVSLWSSTDGLTEARKIGEATESIPQFIWIDAEEIVFASDKNNFWNLYRSDLKNISLICSKEADFAAPLWTLGKKSFEVFSWKGRKALLCTFCKKAVDCLAVVTMDDGQLFEIPTIYTVIRTLDVQKGAKACFIGGSHNRPLSIVELDLEDFSCEPISQSFTIDEYLEPFISIPEEVSALSSLDQKQVFGFYYFPKNPSVILEESKRPPLIIRCHGGPTAHVSPLLSLEVQFWTSRGFAFLDVNYRGSSGFGKEYREALKEQWGIVDVRDSVDLAQSLVIDGKASKEGLFARGSSSGGFTALCMAVSGVLKGCVSVYGVTDLTSLSADTHKFEKYYLESLVGSEETESIRYVERSPVSYPDKIVCPVLFLHGDNDFVVPLSQAEALAKKIDKGTVVVFPGEGHGFKQSSTIQKCLELELSFYQKALGLDN